MRKEPANKRTVVFIYGQNLFYGAREAFGYPYPNFEVFGLASGLCIREKFALVGVRFTYSSRGGWERAFGRPV